MKNPEFAYARTLAASAQQANFVVSGKGRETKEQASSHGNIQPLAKFFAELVSEQSVMPLPRPKA